ncbi:hypothetical protein SORBI_3009G057100 [Sorghum bicolor]|uniref:Uncharacterized protein n=2 Tax=Sorghum bicolor TaxID=4558 RepID=A0A1B6P726_SORBI|nr:hypothetical protein SORBI_3009G057100 [Sorghum bicolor]OQU77502.1 hypothetical protein SORBI_3009G057100 [Sorghum bicolor]OQU77503.1 hypothetical protein SORBI_3009G057100 [Sorghum bicolor]OQU77504.1 hypothetical protein SORBI_3009G057100 [Sorghum bicolor]
MCLPSPATAWLVPTIYRDASIHPTLVCPARNSASQRWCYQLGTDLFSYWQIVEVVKQLAREATTVVELLMVGRIPLHLV